MLHFGRLAHLLSFASLLNQLFHVTFSDFRVKCRFKSVSVALEVSGRVGVVGF